MSKINKYLLSLGISFGLIFIFSFFVNVFNYFEILSSSIYKFILIILVGISVFIGGFYLGKNSKEKGYIRGLIFGFIISLTFFISSYLFYDDILNTSSIIYYLIIIIVSLMSSVIGINVNKDLEIKN